MHWCPLSLSFFHMSQVPSLYRYGEALDDLSQSSAFVTANAVPIF